MGISAICLCLTDDHVRSAELFTKEGIGISIGKFTEITGQKLIESALFYITEKKILEEMSERASLLKISNINQMSSIIIE